jgi:hypothetical protein
MASVGTWHWAEKTGGRLRRRDRFELIRQVALARLSRLPRPWRSAILGDRGALALPRVPDSAIASLADDRARELSSPGLYAHCVRTWMFAAMFAERDRVDYDEELLYLACILHDLGLTARHTEQERTAQCFAVEGARAAHRLLQRNGQEEERARLVAEAISLHLNITVPKRLGAEAHLLNRGAMLETIGRYADRLPLVNMQQVVNRWPRDEVSDLFLASAAQTPSRPHARAAFMQRLPNVAELVLANPLDHLPGKPAPTVS